ncbi:MAG: CoA ester lyase [Limnohabitans sp.]|nr:MAG: CoA ester lyase [Limnohabitans sp.]
MTMHPSTLCAARSFLFVPANRPERFAKALASGADAVILDLEDSVPLDGKAEARDTLRQAWPQLQQAACAAVIRINSPDTEWGQQDLSGLQGLSGLAGIMVPKCEGAHNLQRVAQAFAGVPSLPIIESALGYLALREIAQAPQVGRLVVGHIDFLADTGMNVGEDQRELDSLRFEVAMCTRLGKLAPAVDGVTVSVDDEALIRADTERALRFGFGAKLCIHPRQVPVVHATLAPTPTQIEWAQRVLAAMQASKGSAVQLDGKMVDLPVVLQAQRLLERVR